MRCERCGSGIIVGRTECHICGAAVAAAPEKKKETPVVVAPAAGDVRMAPEEIEAGIPGITTAHPNAPLGIGAAPPPPMGGGMRVSLTGEVYDAAPAPMPLRPPTSASGPRPPAPRPGARGGGKQREYLGDDEGIKKGNPFVAIFLILVLLGAGGGGGFWWWNKQQAPARPVKGLMEALKSSNMKEALKYLQLPAAIEQMIASAPGGRETVMDQMAVGMARSTGKVKEYRIEGIKQDGDKATIKVWAKGQNPAGQSSESTRDIPVKLVNNEWKVDLDALIASAQAQGGLGLSGF